MEMSLIASRQRATRFRARVKSVTRRTSARRRWPMTPSALCTSESDAALKDGTDASTVKCVAGSERGRPPAAAQKECVTC
eukprot:4575277-Pleurochrysis_carterae.AAC.1